MIPLPSNEWHKMGQQVKSYECKIIERREKRGEQRRPMNAFANDASGHIFFFKNALITGIFGTKRTYLKLFT